MDIYKTHHCWMKRNGRVCFLGTLFGWFPRLRGNRAFWGHTHVTGSQTGSHRSEVARSNRRQALLNGEVSGPSGPKLQLRRRQARDLGTWGTWGTLGGGETGVVFGPGNGSKFTRLILESRFLSLVPMYQGKPFWGSPYF